MSAKNKAAKKQSSEDELKAQLARALADYDNLRKRLERERGEITDLILAGLVSKFLPVFDMLFKAQEHARDSGLAMALAELERVLSEEGIEKIRAAKGTLFDEELHEAVDTVKGGKDGEIVEEVLTGWKVKDGPVIRHAKVKVSKNK